VPPEVSQDALPTEFRMFAGPVSTSENGDVLFDALAADSVRANWERHWGRVDGHDLMIDLDHAALFQASADAMGWARLDFRGSPEAPELWAVDVKWTEEGARRLRSRSQRFMSPMFTTHPHAEPAKGPPRVQKLINVALTALPATDGLEALVAASQFAGKKDPLGRLTRSMDTAVDMAKLAEGLGLTPEATPEDILATMQALAARMAADMGADDAAEPAEAPEASKEDPSKEEDYAETKAAKLIVLSMTGEKHVLAAVSTLERWKQAYVEQESAAAKLAAERAKLEAAERRSIGAALVQAGLAPALVWSDDSARELAPALASQPLDALRAYAQKAGAQPKARTAVPSAAAAGKNELSARELAMCSAMSIDPAAYAARKVQLKGV
jgi:phage I-like protein